MICGARLPWFFLYKKNGGGVCLEMSSIIFLLTMSFIKTLFGGVFVCVFSLLVAEKFKKPLLR